MDRRRGELSALIVLFFVSVITHWRWFLINGMFGWGDFNGFFFRLPDTWKESFSIPFIWSTQQIGLGAYNIVLSVFPVEFLFGFLSVMGVSFQFSEKLILFIPAATLPLICSFLLFKKITGSIFGAVVGSLVFSYNVYTLTSQIGGHILISIAYALAPLVILSFMLLVAKPNLRNILIFGLVSFACLSYEFRIYYITAWLIFFYFVIHYLTLLISNKFSLRDFFRSMAATAGGASHVFLLSSFFLLPLLLTGSLNDNIAVKRGLFGDGYMSLKQSVAFFFPWWTAGKGYANGVVQDIPRYFYLIPLFAGCGFLLNFKKKNALYMAFLCLLGIFLTKQSAHPFPDTYKWLYNNLPGFNAFRESSKFYLILALGYGGLISYLIAFLSNSRNQLLKFLSVGTGGLIILIFLFNSLPLINGSARGLFIERKMPTDYAKANVFFQEESKKGFFRTLWVPAYGMWSFFDEKHPRIGLYDIFYSFYKYPLKEDYLKLLESPEGKETMDRIGVRFVILPARDQLNENDILSDYGVEGKKLNEKLDVIPDLKPVNLETETLKVYENEGFHNLVTIENVSNNQIRELVQENPAKITVRIDSDADLIHLNLSQGYHSGWKIYQGDIGFIQTLWNNPLASSYKNDYGLNSFQIQKGSFENQKLSFIFTPQAYVHAGLLVSLTTMVLSISYLLLHVLKNPLKSSN